MDSAVDLSQLRDIHLPDPVSWWPPAIGWWLLVLFTIMLVAVAFWFYRNWRRQHWRREALAELAAIEKNDNDHEQLKQLSVLLRRIMMTREPRLQVASLTGSQWLAALNKSGGKLELPPALLIESPYQPVANIDLSDEFEQVKRWIKSLPSLSAFEVVANYRPYHTGKQK